MKKYAISISDGHDEDWFFYDTKEKYENAFYVFKIGEEDMHGYVLNENNEYEVIDSYWGSIV